ncbi:hypothetical protein EON80_21225 [bacterium]|nr:MAG: hypothetical protein EON80_21225 [bacterium]
MKWFVAVPLAFVLAGCSSGVNVPVLESETLTAYNNELAKVSKTARAEKVALVHESGNKYVGFVDMNDGSRIQIDVTYDGTKLIYRAHN